VPHIGSLRKFAASLPWFRPWLEKFFSLWSRDGGSAGSGNAPLRAEQRRARVPEAVYLQKRGDHRISLTTFPEDSTGSSPCITAAEIRPRPGEWYHVVGTRDQATRTQRSASVFFPGVRHGTPIEVPGEVFEKVALYAGGD
jgi:hypothetical protein